MLTKTQILIAKIRFPFLKVRFTSYTGTKDEFENFATLPTTFFSMINETSPLVAQWNYKVLCHPLKKDLPLNRLVPIDDLKTRMYLNRRYEDYLESRTTRFQIAPEDSDDWDEVPYQYTYLDDLMGEIPGPNNYPGHIEDDVYGNKVFHYSNKVKGALNVARYHRVYRVKAADAVGRETRRRGFGDANLFVSVTTQEHIPGLEFERCNVFGKKCERWFQRVAYAVPLEVIYLTPLASWNPHNIPHKGDARTPEGQTVYEGPNGQVRRGYPALNKAYNGTNSEVFYRTPLEFFQDESDKDPADTTKDYKCFLNPSDSSSALKLRASGVRIFMPEIPGVGTLRQRYPIVPVSGEGLGVWKELDALKDLVMFPSKFEKIFRNEVLLSEPREP